MNDLPTVAFVNESTVIDDQTVLTYMRVLQQQVHEDFRPYWNAGANLRFVPHGGVAPTGAWVLAFLDNSDQAGALGYHDVTADGLPLAKVFVATDQKYGLTSSVTASHELLEMLADPHINTACQAADGAFYALEVGDPVEADADGYFRTDVSTRTPVLVSNFVTPAWFGTGSGRYDFRGLLTSAHELRPGGYCSVFQNGQWTQRSNGDHAPDLDDQRNRSR